MEAIGLNPIRLDRIGLDPIRVNAIKLGVPGAASGSDRPYIDPEVLASLVAVCICDGKSNDDPDRAVIKNLVDPDNPFVISNAAYKLNSGYGKYEEDFSLFALSNRFEYSEISNTKVTITAVSDNATGIYHAVTEEESALYWNTFKIKVSGSTDDVYISYVTLKKSIRLYNGINTVVVPNELSWHAFVASATNVSCNITLEFVPEYEGALVTDGKDDLITSTKTVKEMLGGSNEVTVVSMMANLDSRQIMCNSNFSNTNGYNVRNTLEPNGVISMLGYTDKNGTTNNLNLIMGDKNSIKLVDKVNFNSDYVFHPSSYNAASFKTAWYWTIIANKVLTTDQINQVISYFNLDKHVKPDIIYDTIRQGITNENHASFNDELTDFSGNGHNMKIYNSAWKLGSGIGKYEADYSTWTKTAGVISTPFGFKITEPTHNYWLLYTSNITVPAHKVEISGIPEGGEFRYLGVHILKNGINELPKMEEHPSAIGFTLHRGTTQPSDWVGLSVEQIPDYEGALVSDGIEDYGKVENLPIYKDYTVVADREMLGVTDGGVFLKGEDFREGAFSFDYTNESSSFGGSVQKLVDTKRLISYQSKYVNNGININAGTATDTDKLWLAKLGNSNRYSKLALWSFLLFPYTLSEFLLERQLKRYKLGTLYPDMVEFRPVISRNIPYNAIEISQGSTTLYNKSINKTGIYLQEGSTVRVYIQPSGIDEVSKITINGIEYTDLPINPNGFYYAAFPITKSPQKISYAIDEYIRYEDIVQPYPAIINLKQDGKTITWGDKLKVGSDIVFVESANLLPELYTVSETRYNGVTLYPNTIIKVEKSMVFDNARIYLKANEPNCILSPNRLRIPNSSYKILGYIPDLTGNGNHGRLNNFAYTEESGANEDGSIRIDGTDDHITISNIIGGKCIMAKVTINRISGVIYDQRRANVPNKSWLELDPGIVAFEKNAVSTYIDGILNHNVICSDLVSKTVNLTCELEMGDTSGTYQPAIGSSYAVGYTTNINLYEFMLFPDVPDEEEIKELNEVMGIENNIEVS